MDGILNVYKEKNYTSHDVIAILRGIIGIKRIGHAGTLDPMAEGVLPVCIGMATKAADYIGAGKKKYRATLSLGTITDTQDGQGNIIKKTNTRVSQTQVIEALDKFRGSSYQIPPMYSAVRVGGQRLYTLARQGIEVKRKKREIFIYNIDRIIKLTDKEYVFDVECSRGTYVRTLCHDVGLVLGTGAHMKDLIRLSVGQYKIDQALKLKEIENMTYDELVSHINPLKNIYANYDKIVIEDDQANLLYNGNKVCIEKSYLTSADKYRVFDSNDNFIGIYEVLKDRKNENPIYLKPSMFFYRK